MKKFYTNEEEQDAMFDSKTIQNIIKNVAVAWYGIKLPVIDELQ